MVGVAIGDALGGVRAGLPRRVALKMSGRIRFVEFEDIQYIEASGYYIEVYTREKKYLIRDSLTNMVDKLPPSCFIRIHRSATVNTACIRTLRPLGHGEHAVLLHSGKELKLSRSYRRELEAWLGQPL